MTSLGLATVGVENADAAQVTSISVDFTKKTAAVPRTGFGFTFSTFGVEGGPVVDSPQDIAALARLRPGTVRLHLEPGPGGTVISGAGGGDTSISGDRWLDVIDRIGAEPVVIVNADQTDALDVLRYVTANGHSVKRFIIGNEMDENSKSDLSAAEYTSRFRSIARAMREVTPGLEIGGPAPAWFDTGLMRTFIAGAVTDAPAIEKASFVDFHAYGSGAGVDATMAQSVRYIGQIRELRAMIDDPSVRIQVGEFNMNWGDESQNNTHFASVWNANAFGSIVSEGATALLYADKNNAMGLVGAAGTPKASYIGMEMFTGQVGGLRHFGTSMVSSSSSDPHVRVYASTDQKNIVVVNAGEATVAQIGMIGATSGSVVQWQSSGADGSVHRPVKSPATSFGGGRFSASLPPMSISTFVVDAAAATPTPTPTSSPAPTSTRMPTEALPGLDDSLWKTRGVATRADGTATLTTAAQRFSAGSVFYDRPVAVQDLDIRFTGRISAGTGADGMTLSLLDPASSERLGGIGAGLGYTGLTGQAVTFDTWDNERDRAVSMIGLAQSATGGGIQYAATTTAIADIRTTRDYRVRIHDEVVTVWMDGKVVVRKWIDLPRTVVIAFTAGTGSTSESHVISDVSGTVIRR